MDEKEGKSQHELSTLFRLASVNHIHLFIKLGVTYLSVKEVHFD